jgi:hypothetical protein
MSSRGKRKRAERGAEEGERKNKIKRGHRLKLLSGLKFGFVRVLGHGRFNIRRQIPGRARQI